MPNVLVTGAAGFIGSAFLRRFLPLTGNDYHFKAFVRNTNTRNLERLRSIILEPRLHLIFGDVLGDISGLCEGIDWVVHFAAKTFVDHSIRDPEPFIMTNTVGTLKMLEEARKHKVKQFIYISTDEVYGSILDGAYTEDARLNPTNPYSAAKASADCLTISYAHTFGMHTTVTRTENNYGKFQHPQKAMPVFFRKAVAGEPLPVFGDGLHVRQWLHTDDHCDGIWLLLHTDHPPGEVFNIAGSMPLTNLELAHRILDFVDQPHALIKHLDDYNARPGHDRRYALDASKIKSMGWKANVTIDAGFERVLAWYRDNPWWFM